MKTTKETDPERKRILFKKFSKFLRTTHEKAEFEEPIVILMRRGRRTEFFEKAKQGQWQILHSDGETRTILLDTQYMRTFEYGKSKFQGYICHEDFPLPLPEDPVMTSELMGIALEKTLNDIKKWKAQEWKAKGDFFMKIAIAIAVVIGMYILFKIIFPGTPAPAQIIQPAVQTVQNTTVTILG